MSPQADAPDRGPVPNPVPSFWTAEPEDLDDYCSSSHVPSESDVVIIGAGFAGVATAYHLIKDNPNPPSITIIEARNVTSGATGRNGGHVKPDMYYNVSKYAKLYGVDAAAELAAFEAAHPLAVKELVEQEGIDCDFQLTRAVDVFLKPEHAKRVEAAYRELLGDKRFKLSDLAFTPKKDAERISGVKGAQCCFSYTAAHLWPAKLVRGLLQGLLRKGLKLYTKTPVTSIATSVDSENRWLIQTTRGAVRARKIVYATNAYTAQLLPEYAGHIVPVRGICCRITSPKGVDSPHLVNTYGIRFDDRNNDYLIPRADGSIIVGGARQEFWHKRERWFDSVKDDQLIEEAVPYFKDYMQRHFRGWESSGAEVDKVWTGILGYSSDYMPHLGQVPDKPGQFIIAGFSGHGMPQILLSSKAVAALIRDGTPLKESGTPRMFQTSKERISNKNSPLEEGLAPLWANQIRSKL